MGITSIIIPVHNEFDSTVACIEHIRKFTRKDTYEIIVVNNASTDNTTEWLLRQNDIKVIQRNTNDGFLTACNLAVRYTAGTECAILHNDVLVGPNWLSSMKKLLYSNEHVGAVGPICNRTPYFQNIFQHYFMPVNDAENIETLCARVAEVNQNKFKAANFLYDFCVLIKKSAIDDIGLFDEIFKNGFMEDIDFSFRLMKKGYGLLVNMEVFVYHNMHTTIIKTCPNIQTVFDYAQHLFKEKWGFSAVYSLGVRYELINKMDLNKQDLSVLEIGSACGGTLLEILNRNCETEIHGIELDEKAAAISKLILGNNTVEVMNVEKNKLPFSNQSFDYVIAGDILEHLYDPWQTISDIWHYLKKDGCLIASIPNVKHSTALKNLFNLDWQYEDAGILDKTHLRFFTKNEIENIFADSSYNKISIESNRYFANQKFVDKLTKLTKTDSDEYNTLQWIVKACK
ncbi:glycosyltransferase [Pectinatus haikarae]|uniref:glycosyltransferase n=1 Tax=Pectinatus haikarae TaxID=349096 RepID=UPI0018C7BB7A|nr:glycosyltransferase [Pectinatus haikarae]